MRFLMMWTKKLAYQTFEINVSGSTLTEDLQFCHEGDPKLK